MPGKTKGGLGKTARSSTLAREQAQAKQRTSGHLCVDCRKMISVADHSPVMIMPGRKMAHYHKACYEALVQVPAGSVGKNDQPKSKK